MYECVEGGSKQDKNIEAEASIRLADGSDWGKRARFSRS